MQKNLLIACVGLIAGLAIGFFGANALNRQDATSQPTVTQVNADTLSQLPSQQNPAGGMLPDVAEMIQKAENEPQNFAAQMRTGDMYAQIGRFDRAIEFYKRGVLLKPNDFNANVVLANTLFDSRQFEEAADYYGKALQINGKDVNARTDLGATFVERQNPDYDRAIKEFKAALEIEPKHEPSIYYLGVAYFRKGDVENANKTLSQLEQVNPKSELIARLRQNITSR